MHRFTEVSIGVAVGLAITALWPESEYPRWQARSGRCTSVARSNGVQSRPGLSFELLNRRSDLPHHRLELALSSVSMRPV
jgi:uncharacterized membrane protein YccC